MPAVGTFVKQSWEEVNITVDFSEAMESAETISTATVTVTPKGGTTDLSSTMSGTASIVGKTVVCLIKGGTTANNYLASYRVVTDGAQKFEGDVIIKVLDVV